MNATVTALAQVRARVARDAHDAAVDRLATLQSLLRQGFLTEAGWDPDTETLTPPRTHPLLGADRGEQRVVLAGLTELLQTELLFAVQARTDAGAKAGPSLLRGLVRHLRAHDVTSLTEAPEPPANLGTLLRTMARAVRRALATPETERHNDVWDLAVFGLRGTIDFTGISQSWLRHTAKRWAEHDLPRHRSLHASRARAMMTAVSSFSECLRLAREDQGEVPAALSRGDIQLWLDRLAYQERSTTLTAELRMTRTQCLGRFLTEIRLLGFTAPGGPADGLSAEVILIRGDVPTRQRRESRGRDLPGWVLATIIDQLPVLEQQSGIGTRHLIELMIDTGRRPDELRRLPYHCLDRASTGEPVLVYTDFKNNRPHRRLPISEDTAQVILDQQTHVRQQFPNTPLGQLALFPRLGTNRAGTRPLPSSVLVRWHRKFVQTIAHLLTREVTGRDGTPRTEMFDPAWIVLYSYRHTFAQRHADAGTAPDVLRELMSHRTFDVTQHYYRVTEKRMRNAVDRLQAPLADDDAPPGNAAEPMGTCPAPSPSGTDRARLSEMSSHLQQLLADWEQRFATSLDDPSVTPPSDTQIARLRNLIRQINDILP
ncbi:tyrosine-type recombinase/integrase [Amycolatopsis alkalitolerans]|uniref:Site-specific integrase n=1 Tax=Amycolatopsis alkalitolerans TaxID=2547244 RepID=A0A5C4M6H6_9PSEU|nr:site-specific integrase [Amycolatopsis alkalitolerans]TNC26397.1 site-specific integrase [Amycolatopsis alkalitolerans]